MKNSSNLSKEGLDAKTGTGASLVCHQAGRVNSIGNS